MERDEWNERYASKPLLFDIDPDPVLRPTVGGLVPGRALDLAAGEGRASLWLAAQGWQVTAVDFSEVALERGRRRAAERGLAPDAITWVCEDLRDYAPEPDSLDLIVSLFSHPEPPHRRRLLAACARALRPGGEILVVGYHPAHVTEREREGGPQDAAILFTPEDIAADLPALDVVRGERVDLEDAVDTVVHARKPI